MARPARLIAGIGLVVLLAHVVAIQWLGSQWRVPTKLKPLATPMLTRQIAQVQPAAVVAPPPAPPPPPKPVALSPSIPARATPTLPEPLPQPLPVPALPQPTATVASVSPTLTVVVSGASGSGSSSLTATVNYLDTWPADTRLTYKLSGNYRGALFGDAQVQWLRDEQRYETRIDIKLGILLSMIMTSQGEVLPDGLRPRVYEEAVAGKVRSLSFTDTEILYANGTRALRPLGLQDTASQFVELTQQFSSGRAALEVGNKVTFWMARPGGVDEWTYDIAEKVMLDMPPLGAVETYHLRPRPLANPRGNITAEMWFAPSLQYLPVRIRINMDAATYIDLLVEKIEQK